MASIASSSDFVDLCALFGYYAEEHVVQTGDGYLLGLHRLCCKRGEEAVKVNTGDDSIKKPVVYLHHGLMMNSEVWVCLTEKERSLPFMLVEKGYDVWVSGKPDGRFYQNVADGNSWAIIAATSIRKSPPDFRLHPIAFGTFPSINSPFMIFRTV